MYALTRALQAELGITALSSSFGPTTYSTLLSRFPTITSSTTNTKIKALVQCALWCKGYSGGGTFGTWDATTTDSVSRVRSDIGLSASPVVFPKLFKSLLTMDAYVVISPGSALIRQIQQSLNSRYVTQDAFYIIPCDGIYSRNVQTGLLYALQYEIGLGASANGNLGPATKTGLSTAQASVKTGSVDSTKYFVHLFQAGMVFNGYFAGPYDGVFTAALATKVREFQKFVALPQTGGANFQTWASLLVSTGDPDRQGQAADCITTITTARASTLLNLGYTTIGRYLTNTPDVDDPTDKNIKPGELATIFANQMKVFPIFQEGGTGTNFFSSSSGKAAGYRAYNAATAYGFKPGTIIYFAVDFDALESEVVDYVVPHFAGINAAFRSLGSQYRVGVYGARNTCGIVSAAGHAVTSFVSGMSTGYSGNLGYKLPQNWAFDQVKEYTVGSGDGAIGIDNDIMSGLDQGQSSVQARVINSELFAYLDRLHALAVDFLANHNVNESVPLGTPPQVMVLQYLRLDKYNDANLLWGIVAGVEFVEFTRFLEVDNGITRLSTLIEPSTLRPLGLNHLCVAANGVMVNPLPNSSTGVANVTDMAGWSGDLIQVDASLTLNPGVTNVYSWARNFIGSEEVDARFWWGDLVQDVDGYNIGAQLKASPSLTVAAAFRAYYGSSSTAGWRKRFTKFRQLRLTTNYTTAQRNAFNAMVQPSDSNYSLCRTALYFEVTSNTHGETTTSTASKQSIAKAFVDEINERAGLE